MRLYGAAVGPAKTDGAVRTRCALSVFLCTLIPGARAGQPTGNQAVELRQLADGVWLHTSYYIYSGGVVFPSNGLVVREGSNLTLIDTAWGEIATLELLDSIARTIDLPVTRAIVTHAHGDRLAGADVLRRAGVPVFASPVTQRIALDYGMPVPDYTLGDLGSPGASISSGALEVLYPGHAHSIDNLVIWLPTSRILFGGCAVRSLGATSTGNIAQADIDSWKMVIQTLQQRFPSIQLVVPGHGKPGGPELLVHTAELLNDATQ